MAEASPSLDRVQSEALALGPSERSELVRLLMRSLVPASEDEVARAWLEEADRRWEEMERTGDQGALAEEVIQGIRSRLRG